MNLKKALSLTLSSKYLLVLAVLPLFWVGCFYMKQIQLTQGKVALVDDEDFDYLNQFKWAAAKFPNNYYAVRYSSIGGKQVSVYMHREILGVVDGGIFVDHQNHDGLDNQRVNLRTGTHQDNQRNKRSKAGSSSKYVGVCWHKKDKKWQAAIAIDGKQAHLGQFDSEVDAAVARDVAAKKHYGEFAKLNFK